MKRATTTEEQIDILQKRGMSIADKKHATDVLLSVGYYRMGFYWFPFEICQDLNKKRNHLFNPNTTWEKAEALYNFDDRFRNLLSFYLQTIETDIRTYLTYTVSNHYSKDPAWFANPQVVSPKFISKLPEIYGAVEQNDVIKRHKKFHYNDVYAPAWKTIEFFTFGSVLMLYKELKNKNLQKRIAERYDIRNINVFISYVETLRRARNVCAHSHILYDLKLPSSIRPGLLRMEEKERSNISGVLKITYYVLSKIDKNKEQELRSAIRQLVESNEYNSVQSLLEHVIY